MQLDVALPSVSALTLHRAAAYAQLVRPRMGLLVIATVAVGGVLGAGGEPDWNVLVQASIATALLFAGASALNQLVERHTDALMSRTANRPMPAGLLKPWEAMVLGCVLSADGLAYLLAAGQLVAAALGAFALVVYVLVYTPLKIRTPHNTLIGAIPGAVPPLMGWAAAGGKLDRGAAALFLIVLLWQIPHFLAIAWIYRDEYARAGLRMFPLFDPSGVRTGRQMAFYTLALIAASLLPFFMGTSGWIAAIGAVVLGFDFLFAALAFARNRSTANARQVFRASLVYLTGLSILFALDAVANRGM